MKKRSDISPIFDQLTSLPNRSMFYDRTKQSWKYAVKEKNLMAIMFLDLDGFKSVNDTMGHDEGDQVLIEISKRFMECLDDDHTLARLGGDEFTILLPTLKIKNEAVAISNKILDSLKEPFVFEDMKFYLSASIGIAFFDGHENINVGTLIKRADTAMYYIKERGKRRL